MNARVAAVIPVLADLLVPTLGYLVLHAAGG